MKLDVEITFESHPISYTQLLDQDIINLEIEMKDNYPGHLSSEDIEDVNDKYQAMLEYRWYCDEIKQQIAIIKQERDACYSKLTDEQKLLYAMFD